MLCVNDSTPNIVYHTLCTPPPLRPSAPPPLRPSLCSTNNRSSTTCRSDYCYPHRTVAVVRRTCTHGGGRGGREDGGLKTSKHTFIHDAFIEFVCTSASSSSSSPSRSRSPRRGRRRLPFTCTSSFSLPRAQGANHRAEAFSARPDDDSGGGRDNESALVLFFEKSSGGWPSGRSGGGTVGETPGGNFTFLGLLARCGGSGGQAHDASVSVSS